MTTTTVIVMDGEIQPTQIGFAWRDALDALWCDAIALPLRVEVRDEDRRSYDDETDLAVKHLAARTFDEGETPPHLVPLFEAHDADYFDPDRHTHLMRDPNAGLRLGSAQLGIGRHL